MINGFNMQGEPGVSNSLQERGVGVVEIKSYSVEQISKIDNALNNLGLDFTQLKNFIDMAREDGVDATEFLARLDILSKAETPTELKSHIKDWTESL